MSVRVSTIIPVYNGAATVGAAIDSALAQDFDGQEIIVVNDGSTDDTGAVLNRYEGRIRVINQPNRGPAAARNAGAVAAAGDFIALLDADDTWAPNMLAASRDAFESKLRAVLSFTDFKIVNQAGEVVISSVFKSIAGFAHAPSLEEMLVRCWPILPSATMMRRAALIQAGGFDERFRKPGWEDFHLWLLLREQGPFAFVPATLATHLDCDTPEKYMGGLDIFLKLTREHFGQRVQPLKKIYSLISPRNSCSGGLRG